MSRSGPDLHLNLPAGLLYVWPAEDGDGGPKLLDKLDRRLAERPGIHCLRPGLFAALPRSGDADILDAAVACGRSALELLHLAGTNAPGGRSGTRLLVLPSRVEVHGDSLHLHGDPLTHHLEQRQPRLAPEVLHLTHRAALQLETPWKTRPTDPVSGPAGRSLPLFRVDGIAEEATQPWRNRQIWDRPLERVARPTLETELKAYMHVPALRVTGPLGVGKTRTVIEQMAAGTELLHMTLASDRSGHPPLGLRLLRRALERLGGSEEALRGRIRELLDRHRGSADAIGVPAPGPVARLLADVATAGRLAVVLDQLERASEEDWALVSSLIDHTRPGGSLRVLMVARSETAWPADLTSLPMVSIPPFDGPPWEKLGERLLSGLKLPATVREELHAAGGGNPFYLEEGIIGLIQRRLLRRHYGAFVFSGPSDTGFVPSGRLAAQLEAEGSRLGEPLGLRLLALADGPLPGGEVRSAAGLVGETIAPSWDEPFAAAGWLRRVESPWGAGIELVSEALTATWADSIGKESSTSLRHALGELLSELGGGSAGWRAYRLLAGSPDAVPLLLRLTSRDLESRSAPDPEPPDNVTQLLDRELELHRGRGGDSENELQLLVRLLPRIQREGRLGERRRDLDAALDMAAGRPAEHVPLTALRAGLELNEGRFTTAEEMLRTALAEAHDLDEEAKAQVLLLLGQTLMRQDRYDEAQRIFERILPTLERGDLPELAAACRFHLGNIALADRRLDRAFLHHDKSLDSRRGLGATKEIGASLTALGTVSLARGLYPRALAYYREALEIAEERGDSKEIAFGLLGVGRALGRLGDHAAASAPLKRCLELRERREDTTGEAVARLAVAENLLHLARSREALEEARRALFRLSLGGSDELEGQAEQLLGRIHAQMHHLEEARQHFRAALENHRYRGDELAASFDRAWLLGNAMERGEPTEALPLVLDLAAYLEKAPYPELGERLDYRLFAALAWLEQKIPGLRDPHFYLERAYRTLMRKTAHLDLEMRNRFLHQIPENAQILAAATRQGLAEEKDRPQFSLDTNWPRD